VTRVVALACAAVLLSTALASAAIPPQDAATGASAALVEVTVPGRPAVSLGELDWPAKVSADVQSFVYPNDGSIVSLGSSQATVSAQTGQAAASQASAQASVLSLFGGEIVAGQVGAQVSAGASTRSAGVDVSGSSVQGLRALGQDVPTTPGASVSLGDWGSLQVLAGTSAHRGGRSPAASGSVVALRVRLNAAHGGLPAGSEIAVATASATAVAQRGATPVTTPHGAQVGSSSSGGTGGLKTPQPPELASPGGTIPGGPVKVSPAVTSRLTLGGYVFPVYGPVSFGDSFGAPRSDVLGGWHHGEDIFAPRGAPILAVTDGTLYSIGWNRIGGYRLWLRDRYGNQFYYAHLSAYSPLAVEGQTVKAGDVIGFVGNTGDADGGPTHLHFEIHPSALIGLGYNGVVAPYPFLVAWKHAQDVSFSSGRVYVPKGGTGLPLLPPPGAVLLDASDISATSGLVPGALERALSRRSSP
jgi:murein DD-endopeptidase MepM/ murein hydrolase activator NlpD